MPARLRLAAQVSAVGVVSALLGLLVWSVATEGRSKVPQRLEGRTLAAPDFELARIDRPGELSLASLRGKVVVVNFWASWCTPCKEEAPFLERTWQRYRSQGLVVLGVDYNDVDRDARGFARRYGMTYPLVRDRRGTVLVNDYGGTGVPETFFVDRKGKLVGDRIRGPVDNGEFRKRFDRYLRLALRS